MVLITDPALHFDFLSSSDCKQTITGLKTFLLFLFTNSISQTNLKLYAVSLLLLAHKYDVKELLFIGLLCSIKGKSLYRELL